MAKITWTIKQDGSDITTYVMSFTIQQGRTQYLDQYPGGRLTMTVKNTAGFAQGINYGDVIDVYSGTPGNEFYTTFWVETVTFHDYNGNIGLPTATVVCADWIARAGRVYANALSLSALNTTQQMKLFELGNGGPLPADMLITSTNGSSTAAATTYTGTAANYLNLLQTTERGYLVPRGSTLTMVGRPTASSYFPITTLFSRTTSSTQIAYQEFQRIEAGLQYINTATVQPGAVASQTAVNTSSLASYGPAFYSSATVDNTTTQALGNAEWVVNTFGDPNTLRYEVGFADVAQNATALSSWMSQCWGTFNRTVTLQYNAPGLGDITDPCVIEGALINVTPEQTYFMLSLSPWSYYSFFTLNDTYLGILDESRLGW